MEYKKEKWDERKEQIECNGERGPSDVDYSRIIHSAAFRRLQNKTQIFNLGDSDFYRTRLTHSLEVGQIATGIVLHCNKNIGKFNDIRDESKQEVSKILPDTARIQTICYAHDIGHPPFGHGGEVALNYCMREKGGFEGNAQTLRILTRLEKFSENDGMNLTRRTLLGVLKYPVSYSDVKNEGIKPKKDEEYGHIDNQSCKPPKCYLDCDKEIVNWILQPLEDDDKDEFTKFDKPEYKKHGKSKYKSLDCSIMDIADDIAYGVHDLEDSLAHSLIKESEFLDIYKDCSLNSDYRKWLDKTKGEKITGIKEFNLSNPLKKHIGWLVGYFISSCEIKKINEFDDPLLKYNVVLKDEAGKFLKKFKEIILEKVVRSQKVQHLEFKGQMMVIKVFEALASDPERLLLKEERDKYEKATDKEKKRRVICDYIAGMTDIYLMKIYDRLFTPHIGSTTDWL